MTKKVNMENAESDTEPRTGIFTCLLIAAARGRALRRMREAKQQADATVDHRVLVTCNEDHPATA